MKAYYFYQSGQLSVIGSVGQISVIFRSHFAPLAELRAAVPDNTALLATSATNSIMHAARAIVYAPYGHVDLLGHASVLAFNGQVRDLMTECDLLGNGKRSYSSKLMRFLSPDNYSPFGLGGVNSYVYCNNDPINFTDPSGNVKYRVVMKGRNATSNPPSASNTIARNPPRSVPVVRPMRNGEPVQQQVQAGAAQRPEPQQGALTVADAQVRTMNRFLPGERQLTNNIMAYALANDLQHTPRTPIGQLLGSVVVARQLTLESGRVAPIGRNSIINSYRGTPEQGEHLVRHLERWATDAIVAYRASTIRENTVPGARRP